MKTIKMIMDVPENLHTQYMMRSLSLGTPLNEVLDKIRAEIESYEADCILADDSKECKECDKIVFGSIYRIIDKYREEQE